MTSTETTRTETTRTGTLNSGTAQPAIPAYVGIDVGKAWLDVAVIPADNRNRARRFANEAAGHAALLDWLAQVAPGGRVCLEATGTFGDAPARALHGAGWHVSLINPAQIKAFGKSELLRTKTDKVDAALIARFARAHQPPAWTPPAPEILVLRALVRRCGDLKAMRVAELNRLKSGAFAAAARTSVERLIAQLEAELKTIAQEVRDHLARHPALAGKAALLRTIPGLGERAVAVLLGELPDLAGFRHNKQLAAFVGIAPGEQSSGQRQAASGPISRVGNATVRAVLVQCALSARRHNPPIRAFADRLAAAGKPAKLVLIAVARKLLVQAHAVLRHGTPFDPQHAAA